MVLVLTKDCQMPKQFNLRGQVSMSESFPRHALYFLCGGSGIGMFLWGTHGLFLWLRTPLAEWRNCCSCVILAT